MALLPHPVSPTMPRVSFSSIVKQTLSTAVRVPRLRRNWTVRLLTSSKGRFIYVSSLARIKDIAQPVADKG